MFRPFSIYFVVMFCCLIAGPAIRQAAAQEPRLKSPTAKVEATHTYRTSVLIGMPVKNRSGEKLGRIEDLLVDLDNGRTRYAILSFGGFLGLGDKLFPIPWRELSLRYDETENYFVVDVTRKFLESAPSFPRDKWPDMTPAWMAMIESVFPNHSGTLVGVEKDRLTMTYPGGLNEHSHAVAANATVTRDGKEAKLEELQSGDQVRLTTQEQAGIRVVTRVEARSIR